METAKIVYTGDLRTTAEHVRSHVQIITDAPPDNHGKGEAFSPTDLLATSLGACIATTMAIKSRMHNLELTGMSMKVTKVMAAEPRRVAEVIVDIDMPKISLTEKEKQILERTAHTCPVAKSLHPDLIQTIRFNY